ncbi:MAG TPA: hypothetical protein VL598_01780 [Trinickia sp.]|jgi:hypothetical protein|uniref:hypothetical protein n=1 Tax=Trinickia sp. TaxID=2571163 RepID=UPI002BA2A944|nr:hypothetical protein [Trinickia sp.]HTI16374.1 hypothetical protein [Trinickia sp.]
MRNPQQTVEAMRRSIEGVLTEEATMFGVSVPRAAHLIDEREHLDLSYYLRHKIETVRRIRATAVTDALALAVMIQEDYAAARQWADYLQTEMNHDQLYLADLKAHGLTESVVLSVPPMPATELLMRNLTQRIAEYGSLPAVAYSLFVEWNSSIASPKAVKRAKSALSDAHVKGSRAHTAIDERDDHYRMMIDIACSVMRARHYAMHMLEALVREIAALFRAYFHELHFFAIPTPNGEARARHVH